jgi:hypothetical protein
MAIFPFEGDAGLSRTGFRGKISSMEKKRDEGPFEGGRAANTPGIDMDSVEQVEDSLDTEDGFRVPKVGEVDPALMAIYAGQWVAWSPDGARIVAHADDTTALTMLVIEAGMNPSQCVFERIEEGSLI